MKKISVIIPVYNAEKYLDECIQSVLNQSNPDFELLLINDGSTDSSGTICDGYAVNDNRIKVFHQENAGPSAARNRGIDEIQGEYITFIDADDYVVPDYLKAFIPSDVDINKGIVIQGHKFEYANGKVQVRKLQRKSYHPSLYSELFFSTNLIRLHPYACIKLYPTNLIIENKIYFNEEIKFGEDFIFFLECLKYSEIVLTVEQTGYTYRFNHTSLTRSLHSYESEIKRLNEVRDLLANIATKFSFDEKTTSLHKKYLKRYFYRAIDGLYLHKPIKNRKERLALIHENATNDNYELLTLYNEPDSRIKKIFKYLFAKKLINLLDLYILYLFRFKKLKKF